MNTYTVDRGNFEGFFINNFTKFIDDDSFIINYTFVDNDYIMRHYKELEVEGISLTVGEEHPQQYIAFIVGNEEKIRQVKFLRVMIDNQKTYKVNE